MDHAHDASLIATLVAALAAASLGGYAASRLKLPLIAGYLLSGVLLGPFTPGFVADATIAPQLAEIGVILLMFGAGAHFSLTDLLKVRSVALPGALAAITVVTALGGGLAHTWGWKPMPAVVFGLCLSVASTVVLLRALASQGLLKSDEGRLAIGWLLVEDIVMIVSLVLLPALAALNSHGGVGLYEISNVLCIAILKTALFTAMMLGGAKHLLPWLLRNVQRTGSRELFTLTLIALALGAAFGCTRLFGVSYALGAFFAGAIIGESELRDRAAKNLQPLQDAFGVLFFVAVGMLFDPSILLLYPEKVLATLAVLIIGKSVATYCIMTILGRSSESAFTVAPLISQVGEFSFLLASLATSLGLLPSEAHSLIVVCALLSIMINPMVIAAASSLARLSGRVSLADG